MRSRQATRILTSLTWIAIAAGCYAPNIEDGKLACTADKVCPRGFTCSAGRCYSGAAMDAGTDQRAFEVGTEGGGAGAGGSAGGIGGSVSTGRGGGVGGASGTIGSAGTGAGGRGGTIGTGGTNVGGSGGTSGTGGTGAAGRGGTTGTGGTGAAGRGGTTGAGGTSAGGSSGTSGTGGTGAGGRGGTTGVGGAGAAAGTIGAGGGAGTSAGGGGGSGASGSAGTGGKAGPGSSCTLDTQCAAGACVDQVCCNAACTAPCQACDVDGHRGECWPVTGTTPHGGRPACVGTGTCGGYCNGLGSGQCFYPGSTISCQCDLLPGSCDQGGGCQIVGKLCI